MTDRVTGEPREVDVVVRSRIGEHEIVVSVECLEQSRKATVSWIEQMITKHPQLLSATGVPQKTLGELVYPLLQSWEKFGEKAAAGFFSQDRKAQFWVELKPRKAIFVANATSLRAVSAIRAYVSGHAITMPVALKGAAWRDLPLAYGSGPSPLGKISVTVMSQEGHSVEGVATVVSPRTGNPETVVLEPQPESSSFSFIAQGGSLGFTRSNPKHPIKARRNRRGKSAT